MIKGSKSKTPKLNLPGSHVNSNSTNGPKLNLPGNHTSKLSLINGPSQTPKPTLTLVGINSKTISTNSGGLTKKASSTNTAKKTKKTRTPEQEAARKKAVDARAKRRDEKAKTELLSEPNKTSAAAAASLNLQALKNTTPKQIPGTREKITVQVPINPVDIVDGALHVADITTAIKKSKLEEEKQKQEANNAFTAKRAEISKNSQDIKKMQQEIDVLSSKKDLSPEDAAKLEQLKTDKPNKEAALYDKKVAIGSTLTPKQAEILTYNNRKRKERKTKRTETNNVTIVKTNANVNKTLLNSTSTKLTNNQPKKTDPEIALEKAEAMLKQNNVVPEKVINPYTGKIQEDVSKTPSADIERLQFFHNIKLQEQDANIQK